jgi:hypothetical protein
MERHIEEMSRGGGIVQASPFVPEAMAAGLGANISSLLARFNSISLIKRIKRDTTGAKRRGDEGDVTN